MDGNTSDISENSSNDNNETSEHDDDESTDGSVYDTEDEAFSEPTPVNLFPVPGQNPLPGQAIRLEVNLNYSLSSNLPLCLLFNSRSIFNKSNNLKEMLNQICPDICLISETFESERKRIMNVLNSQHFKSISYYRKHRAPLAVPQLYITRTGFLLLT